ITIMGDLNRDSYGAPEVNTPDYLDLTPVERTTLFDLLTSRGVSWVFFQHQFSMLCAFTKYSFDMVNVRQFLDPVNGFEATVAGRNPIGSRGLPSVTFIDPAFGDLPAGIGAAQQDNDDAPPSDLKNGQAFINGIIH